MNFKTNKPYFMSEKSILRRCSTWIISGMLCLSGGGLVVGCSDYDLDDTTPEGWGSSIYNYLETQGNYTNMLKLIDDLGYHDVLARTGSVTLFAADDDAFARFYSNNSWGATDYDHLSVPQKKLLLYGAMLKNSIQINDLASTASKSSNTEPVKGNCMRRLSAVSIYDSVPLLKVPQMPFNKYWAYRRGQNFAACVADVSLTEADKETSNSIPMIYMIENFLVNNKITNADYDFLMNNTTSRSAGDASVNGVNVTEKNIKCMNGFIHKMADVIYPKDNMAEIIKKDESTTIFNHLMERFCAPYYAGEAVTTTYNNRYGTNVDSVFQKRFFSDKSYGRGKVNVTPVTPTSSGAAVESTLKYDPEWNTFYSGEGTGSTTSSEEAIQQNMAVMLVPSDDAMKTFWEEGSGKALRERYGAWDNVPDEVVAKLINNNMLESFVASVPSKFETNVMNDANDPMGITTGDIDKVTLGCNGAIYRTKRVFSPTSYVSVLFPALVNSGSAGNMSVMYWAIKQLQYEVYLNSINKDIKYSLFVPNNNALRHYVDPCSYGKAKRQIFKFYYDGTQKADNNKVQAGIYNYDPVTGVEDSVRKASYNEIINRLKDILNDHIVVGDVEDGNSYFRSRNGSELEVVNTKNRQNGMMVGSSYQVNDAGMNVPISQFYDQSYDKTGGNGRVYVMDEEPLMGGTKTTHDILNKNADEDSVFLQLMEGMGLFETKHKISSTKTVACSGQNINLFNAYHYTVYAPTNKSLQPLLDNGTLPTIEKLESEKESNYPAYQTDSTKLMNFLKYHIQDNALYINGDEVTDKSYETALYSPSTGFSTVTVTCSKSGLSITDKAGNTRHVVMTKGLYNQMAREFQFETDGDTGDATKANNIYNSSSAVIHLIDGPLMYSKSIAKSRRK